MVGMSKLALRYGAVIDLARFENGWIPRLAFLCFKCMSIYRNSAYRRRLPAIDSPAERGFYWSRFL